MALEKSFDVLCSEACNLIEERDGNLQTMIRECCSSRRFEVIQYHYLNAEKAVKQLGTIETELRILQASAENDPAIRRHQKALMISLQVQRYVHVMELYREALLLNQKLA